MAPTSPITIGLQMRIKSGQAFMVSSGPTPATSPRVIRSFGRCFISLSYTSPDARREMANASNPVGYVPIERISAATDGMTMDEVREILGEPAMIVPPSEVVGPSDTLGSIGSTFSFASDRDMDEVWIYRHRERGKMLLKHRITSYLGFREKILRAGWRVHDPSSPPD